MLMRVLLLFPMADGQTGPAIQRAFENLGHTVRAVDAKLHPHNSFKVAYGFKPDLIFCSRTQALTWKVPEIKAKFKNAVACMWNVDTRPNINKYAHLFPLVENCDYHFVVDTKTIPRWRELNPNTFWLPQGLQDEIYDRPKAITNEDKIRYSCDVSFAGGLKGSAHKHRHQYVDAVKQMGVDLKFWGCRGGPQAYDEEHNKMVSLSKINLCCSSFPGNGKYTSVRNYKVLGAEGFALELHREGIHEIFPQNVIRCYTNPEDLVEKVRYWLDHDWERWQIAQTAYEWVRENATYTHRIARALEIISQGSMKESVLNA